jgi:hypothetical protein
MSALSGSDDLTDQITGVLNKPERREGIVRHQVNL